jgi:predicted MFS family arabinose efflux permease
MAIIAFSLAVPNVKESKVEGHPHYDVPGALTATVGMLSVVYGVSQASTDGWGSTRSWPYLALGAILLAVFFVIERRIKEPLLPLRLLTDRVRAGAFLAQLFVGLGLFGMFLFMTFYFQNVEQYSAVKTGLLFMPFSIGIIVAAGMTSQWLPKFGPRPLATIGNLMAAAGMLYLSFIKVHSSYVGGVMPAMIVTSLGLGVAFVSIASTALFNVRPDDTGAASAVLTTSQQIGGSFGTAIANTIVVSSGATFLAAALHHSHPALSSKSMQQLIAASHVHGYDESFRFGALMLFVAAVVFFALSNIDRHHLGQHDESVEGVYPAST